MNAMEIAAYLDRRADAAATQRLEAHLAECDPCRQDLIEAGRVLRQARKPRRILVTAAALAAAAILLVVALPAPGRNDPVWRDDGGAGHPLVAYGPLGEVGADSFRFVWGAAPDAMTYRLTVTSADGTLIWSTNSADTSAVLEPGHPLVPGVTYYWAADALMRDGSALTTGIRAFHLRR